MLGGHRAYCWTTMCGVPSSFRFGLSADSMMAGKVFAIRALVTLAPGLRTRGKCDQQLETSGYGSHVSHRPAMVMVLVGVKL